MKFINYLDEAKETLEEVLAKSKIFLDDANSTNFRVTLYRGTKNGTKSFKKIKPRSDRIPMDSSLEFHNVIDSLYKEKTGYALRSSSIFCSLNMDIASCYNNSSTNDPFVVVPIGAYKLFMHDGIHDMFNDVEDKKFFIFYLKIEDAKEYIVSRWTKLNDNVGKKISKVLPNDLGSIILKDSKKEKREIKKFIDKTFTYKNVIIGNYNKNELDSWSPKLYPILQKMTKISHEFIKEIKEFKLNELGNIENEIHVVCNSYYLMTIQKYRELEELYKSFH